MSIVKLWQEATVSKNMNVYLPAPMGQLIVNPCNEIPLNSITQDTEGSSTLQNKFYELAQTFVALSTKNIELFKELTSTRTAKLDLEALVTLQHKEISFLRDRIDELEAKVSTERFSNVDLE